MVDRGFHGWWIMYTFGILSNSFSQVLDKFDWWLEG